ncbi:MAG TPA: DUF58 domain-containing protein [Phycisphaerales bacterium]|nr:DUF58 domain-containing protein [Phycisphaerales bacterium]
MIARSTSRPPTPDELLDPRLVARLDRLDVRSTRVFLGKLHGERRSKRRGRSVEFDDHRPYVPGDDPRFIDWSIYARLDRLFIKLFLEEEDLALHIALDASASMHAGDPDKLRFAARLAMMLAYIGLSKQNRVGITVFGAPGGGIARLPDRRGRRNARRFAEFLLQNAWPTDQGNDESRPTGVRDAGRTIGFNDALATIARLRVGTGVLILLSDFLIPPPDGYERGLRLIAAAGGYDTHCLQILAPGEIEPEREIESGLVGDLRLTDAETGAAAEITITPALIKRYKERLEAHTAGLHAFAAARDMSHTIVRTDSDLEALFLDTLRARGVLG